jgi:hypothetical protein
MFSTRTRPAWRTMALAGALGLGVTAASAQTIVVSSAGPSARAYPAGKSLAAGSRIVLAAGDTLTVLDSRGTRTLRGPVTTSAEAAATTSNPSFATLIATQNRRRARTGAIRGAGDGAKPSNLWQVNVTADGTYCVSDPAAVQLWRPNMEKAGSLTVAQQSGPSAGADFAVGQNSTAWPANVPIADGRDYVVSGAGLAKPMRLRLVMLGAPAADPAGTYAALDAKGCSAQKQLLLGTLKSAE